MDDIISAADANRSFSRVLREVATGHSYVVTSHGRPVARIAPVTDEATIRARSAAKRSLLDQLRLRPAQGLGMWSCDELYED